MPHFKFLTALVLVALPAGVAHAQSGPFKLVAPGFQIDFSRSLGAETVAPVNADGLPQGKQVSNLYGIGVTAQWRIGEVLWKVRDLTLQTTLGARFNKESDNADLASYQARVGGSAVTLTNASWERSTRMTEVYFQAPLRWYPMTGGDVEGLFLEAGPGWVRLAQIASVNVSGTFQGQPIHVEDEATVHQNRFVWTMSLGYTKTMRDSVVSYSLGADRIVNAGKLSATMGKFTIQFQF